MEQRLRLTCERETFKKNLSAEVNQGKPEKKLENLESPIEKKYQGHEFFHNESI